MHTHSTMAKRISAFLLAALTLVALAGCQPLEPAATSAATEVATAPAGAEPTAVPAVEPVNVSAPLTLTLAPTETAQLTAVSTVSITAPLTVTALQTVTAPQTMTALLTVTAPLTLTTSPTATAAVAEIVIPTLPVPVLLEIPDLDLSVPVEIMGWEIVSRGGQRSTRWILPQNAAGWHANSARAGEAGTTIISGSQMEGAAVFAPIALGEVEPGQEIVLTDSDGARFLYRVTEVPDPLPVRGGDASAAATAAEYTAPGEEGRLVLITGWPDFTTTHRQFVLADLTGPAE